VAVIAVFRNIAVPVGEKALVEAESLSNDGIAVVIYGMAMVQATGGSSLGCPRSDTERRRLSVVVPRARCAP